jgi:hypothetical protein
MPPALARHMLTSVMDGESIDMGTAGDVPAPADDVDSGIRAPTYRYPVVLGLVFAVVVFLIGAPSSPWTRALAIGVQGIALVVTVGTSRERESVRLRRSILVGVAMLAAVLLIATGVAGARVTALIALIVTLAVPIALSASTASPFTPSPDRSPSTSPPGSSSPG